MYIKFLRPVAGYAYFEGDLAELPVHVAAVLVNSGFAIMIPETEIVIENTLPADLPLKNELFTAGYTDIDMVKNADENILKGIKGIGEKGVKRIIKYLT